MTETFNIFPPRRPDLELWVEELDHYAGPEESFEPAHDGDAGIDLYAGVYAQIPPGEWKLIPCGVRIKLPEGTEGQIRAKSGKALKQGMVVSNAPGTIDEGYRGEIMVLIHNINPVLTLQEILQISQHCTRQPYTSSIEQVLGYMVDAARSKMMTVKPGDKIAQLVITEYQRPPIVYVDDVDDYVSTRGSGGFGSTDVVQYSFTKGDGAPTEDTTTGSFSAEPDAVQGDS